MISKTAVIATNIVDLAHRLGFTVNVRDNVFTLTKAFPKGNTEEFMRCEDEAGRLLDHVPRVSAGSDWGTDSASVGGHSALVHGLFQMHRSGASKRLLSAIRKLV